MLLAIDAGNTHTKFALYKGSWLIERWRATTERTRTADEWSILLLGFLALVDRRQEVLDGCIISSVVPSVTEALVEMARRYLGVEAVVVSGALPLGMPLDYPRPLEVGPDRLVGALAAAAEYGAPVVVVNCGTATTFDVVNEGGTYIGGIIAPGLETALAALSQRGARLVNVPLEFPAALIGQSTSEAMQSGLMWGYVSLVEGLATRLQEQLGVRCPVIGTGGLAPRLASHAPLFTTIDPDLLFKGLYLVWERLKAAE